MTWLSRLLGLRVGAPFSEPNKHPETQTQADISPALASVRADMMRGEIAAAEVRLGEMLGSHPGQPEVHAYAGICSYLRGNISGAKQSLHHAIELDPSHAEAFKFLAACYDAERDDERALDINRIAALLNPGDAQVQCVAAAIYLRRGDRNETSLHINKALSADSDCVLALKLLDQLSIRSTLHRRVFEAGPHVAAARKKMESRFLEELRVGRLGREDLSTLLGSLQNDQATFHEALAVAAAAEHHADLDASLAEEIASVAWASGNGAKMLSMRQLAHQLDPTQAAAELGLAHALLMQGDGDWLSTWQSMTRLQVKLIPEVHPGAIAQWQGEQLNGGRLLVYQDQGVGDAIMAFRLLHLLKARGIKFDLWVVPSLRRLAAKVEGYDDLSAAAEVTDVDPTRYAAAVPLFGLISALQVSASELKQVISLVPEITEGSTFTTLSSPPAGLRIGLVYGGNPSRRDDWRRSVSLENLKPLAEISGVMWTNLMIDERPDRLEVLALFKATDPMHHVRDFAETAALIDQLDGVVAIDSSVAHLACARGNPVWVLLPQSLDWRWQMGNDTKPWWSNARALRAQGTDFSAAISQVVSDLDDLKAKFGRL